MTLKELWAKLHSKDLYTWIGHGAIGFLLEHGVIGFLLYRVTGPAFVAGACVYREASDLVGWFGSDKAIRRPFAEKAKDGFFDLWAPLAGVAVAEFLKGIL
jgi:hypothetical protein